MSDAAMFGAVPASEPPYSCSVCPKTYKRREHLQRHAVSHSTAYPYRCTVCSNSYQRADVLKRHSQTCRAKAKVGGVLAGASSGRRACDLCVRQKKACSTGQPCENCRRKCVPCCYSFGLNAVAARKDEDNGSVDTEIESLTRSQTLAVAGGDTTMSTVTFGDTSPFEYLGSYTSASDLLEGANTNLSWLDFMNFAAGSFPSSQQQTESFSYSFHFLDNFTSRTGLIESFECGTLDQRVQVVSSFLKNERDIQAASATSSGVLGNPLASVHHDSGSASPAFLLQTSILHDPLITKTHQILLTVKDVVTAKSRNSVVTLEWSAILEQRCMQFFSPHNLRKFLELYWQIWHPNVNFMHRPSFDPASSKPVLVAAMALIGATVSPHASDNEDAKLWFNCVEEMVFTDDDFHDPLYTYDTTMLDPAKNICKIQALQASYIVCLYQNWEGTEASKRRIRRYRFSTVVLTARDMGIISARHSDYFAVPQHEFDWKDFTAREQLIRTFLWIYLLDHAFVIFNNLPPRMVIKEMNMHMAWPEAPFQAATASECAQEVHTWLLRSTPMCNITFREVVESFCKDSIGPEMRRCFADLGPLNLFAVVSAFHSLIFLQQNSFGSDDQFQPIRNALHNWKSVWETYSNELASSRPHAMVDRDIPSSDNMWRRVGFMQHSPEYWLLASLLVNRLSSSVDVLPSFDSSQLDDGSATHEPILSKYDQTSMVQVNNLITRFQNVQID